MEKVKITFELSKDYISSIMTIMKDGPDPAGRERLSEAMDSITIDVDDDKELGDNVELKMALALIAIGRAAEKLDCE